jgi:hypothetical protein
MPFPRWEGGGGGATVGVFPHPNFPRQEGRTLEPDTYPCGHPRGSSVKIRFRLCSEIGSRLGSVRERRRPNPRPAVPVEGFALKGFRFVVAYRLNGL